MCAVCLLMRISRHAGARQGQSQPLNIFIFPISAIGAIKDKPRRATSTIGLFYRPPRFPVNSRNGSGFNRTPL